MGNTVSATAVSVTEEEAGVAGELDASINVVTAELTIAGAEAGVGTGGGAAFAMGSGWLPLEDAGDPALATSAMVSVTVVTSGSVSGEADEGGAGWGEFAGGVDG